MGIVEQLQHDLQTTDQFVRFFHHSAVIGSQIRLTFRTVGDDIFNFIGIFR